MSPCRTWIVTLSVVALAIAGCGGGREGDSGESTAAGGEETTGALTKAELIEQGDAICAKANAAVGALETESPDATARIAALYSDMVKSLKDLGNPQETEGIYGEYLRTLGELETTENALKLAVKHGSSGLEAAEKGAEGTLTSFQLYAGEYGFKECSQGPSASTSGA